jgi:L-serine dehydratase
METFRNAKELLALTRKYKKPISEIVILGEMGSSEKDRRQTVEKMGRRLKVMKQAVEKGIRSKKRSVSGMSGETAKILYKNAVKKRSANMASSQMGILALTYAIATGETNARMGQIVAFPTAGASGVIPGVMLAAQKHYRFSDKKIIEGLFTAAGVGMIIGQNATLAGAEGGCQAEIGSAVAMAAAALTELRGGTPEECITASALGLKNLLGLACDPLGGMVEVPCIKRSGILSTLALTASDMAIAGAKSYVPFDEVVESMSNIGKMISPKLRETALGGLAITRTGEKIKKRFGFKENGNSHNLY